jgi:hypothetical protein
LFAELKVIIIIPPQSLTLLRTITLLKLLMLFADIENG